MRSSDRGFSVLILPLALSVVLLISAIVFGVWSYSRMLDYKNNVDSKVGAAVNIAKQQEANAKDAEFAQSEKFPFRTYTGPAAFGSVVVKYPKTWSAYVSDDQTSSPYVDGYLYPNTVPDIQSPSSAFALRIQVTQESYSEILQTLQSYVKLGQSTIVPYSVPNVPGVVGARVDGQLGDQKSGSMVLLPLRNMTLRVWAEAPEFEADFNNNILPNMSFSP